MFIGNGFMEMVDALFGDLGSLILVAVICFCLHHFTKKSRLKARCLKIASLATEDFYQKAEKLLEDTATPDILKRHIYELTIAVTDERAAEIALEVIISSLMNSHEKKLKPDSALIRELDQVRKHRPDIVDTFNDAVRASFASILFSHNSKASVVTIDYVSRPTILALAGKLEKKLHEWSSKNGGDDSQIPYKLHQPI